MKYFVFVFTLLSALPAYAEEAQTERTINVGVDMVYCTTEAAAKEIAKTEDTRSATFRKFCDRVKVPIQFSFSDNEVVFSKSAKGNEMAVVPGSWVPIVPECGPAECSETHQAFARNASLVVTPSSDP